LLVTLNPTTIRDPLLKVLGKLSDLVAGEAISQDEAMAELCRDLGISEDEHGTDTEGRPKVRVWATLAFNRKLKDKGFADGAGRGQWVLTEKGVAAARALLGDDFGVGEALATEPEEPEGEMSSGGGVSWSPGVCENSYSKDSYLQTLAVSSTQCFGHWSSRSEKCKDCPISGGCKAELTQHMSQLGARLNARDLEKARLEEEARRRAEYPEPDPEVPSEDDSIADILNAIEGGTSPKMKAKKMTAAATSKCIKCKNTIQQGEVAWWSQGDGMLHDKCYNEGG